MSRVNWTTGFPKKPTPFRAVFEICKSARYKYLYLRFLRLPPCGILWICPHFDQNILISQHLSFYPINWFLDKSVFTCLYWLIEILLFESEINEKCSLGTVGKISLVKRRIRTRIFQVLAELNVRKSFAKSLPKCSSYWELNSIGTKNETEPVKTKP